MRHSNKSRAGVKLVLDLAPLAAFLIAYRLWGVMVATAAIVLVTAISLCLAYLVEKKLSWVPLASGLLVGIFGGLSLAFDSEIFIKIKPTIINMLFASVLLVGVYGYRRGLLKPLFNSAFSLSDEGWRVLSRRWGVFFLVMAGLNEVIWRYFSTDVWVNFKVFGILGMTLVFSALQGPLVKKYAA